MPLQAQIMDKLVILRGLHFVEEHSAHSLWTGFPERRESSGFWLGRQLFEGTPGRIAAVRQPDEPAAVGEPAYCGTAHRPFVPSGPGLDD